MKDSHKDAAPGNSGAAMTPPAPAADEKPVVYLLLKATKLARFTLSCRSKKGKCTVSIAFPVKHRRLTLKPKQAKAFAADLAAYVKAGTLKKLDA
jgi:hypothetical protein